MSTLSVLLRGGLWVPLVCALLLLGRIGSAEELPTSPPPMPGDSAVTPPTADAGASTRIMLEGRTLYPTTGADIPLYDVVSSFLERAFNTHSRGSATYQAFLRSVGVEPGTPSAEAITKAMFLAQAVLAETPEVDSDIEPALYDSIRFTALRCKVQRMRWVWDDLRHRLARHGSSLDRLDRYLEEQVRPGITIYSTDPAITEGELIVAGFEALPPSRKGEKSPCAMLPSFVVSP